VPTRVLVIEGDGTGREVIPAAIEVIRRLGLGLELHPLNVRAERYLKTGEALPKTISPRSRPAAACPPGRPRPTSRSASAEVTTANHDHNAVTGECGYRPT
jgi:isocitrate/isopropylmalate dehydrogenase